MRVFLLGKDGAAKAVDDLATDDLRNDIIGAYESKLASPPDLVPSPVGDFKDKVDTLQQAWSLIGDQSTGNILSVGQTFASKAFEKIEAGDLATKLFDAASAGVATGGAESIEAAMRALRQFDSDSSRHNSLPKAAGIPVPAFQPRARSSGGGGGGSTGSGAGGSGGGTASIRCVDPSINGYVYITVSASMASNSAAACHSAGYYDHL